MEYLKHFFSHGVPLSVIVECPDEIMDAGKRYPAVMLCHGHSRQKNDGLDILSHELVKNEFLTFRLDFRGCGDTAVHKYRMYCASEWPSDLICLINYADSLGIADMTRIGVAGISMGASTAVSAAGTDKRIRSVVSMSGIGDCRTWIKYVWDTMGGDYAELEADVRQAAAFAAATGEITIRNVLDMYHYPQADRALKIIEPFFSPGNSEYLAWDTMQELLMYRPIEKCPQIMQPIFFMAGEKDLLVPNQQSRDMYNATASKNKKIKVYNGVDHNIPMDPLREEPFGDICSWFLETL